MKGEKLNHLMSTKDEKQQCNKHLECDEGVRNLLVANFL